MRRARWDSAGLTMEGPCEKECRGLPEQRVAPGCKPASKWGPKTYSGKELDSANNFNDLGNQLFSRASR